MFLLLTLNISYVNHKDQKKIFPENSEYMNNRSVQDHILDKKNQVLYPSKLDKKTLYQKNDVMAFSSSKLGFEN